MDKINMQGINHLCTVYFIKRGFPVYSLIILIQSQVCMLKLSRCQTNCSWGFKGYRTSQRSWHSVQPFYESTPNL